MKEYYANVLHVDTSGWYGNANAYYANAAADGLVAFPNSGTTPPDPNDILVFDGDTDGHVAIVETVSASSIKLIEQNWSPSGEAVVSLTTSGGKYTVGTRGTCNSGKGPSCYTPIGWLRLPSQVASLSITTTALSPATATVGTAYSSLAMMASGGTAPYTWSATGGPSGLTMNPSTGVLSGTPTGPGTFNLAVAVHDNGSPQQSTSNVLTLTVNPVSSQNPVPTITGLNPSSLASSTTPQTLTINGTGFVSSSSATFNGIPHAATFVNAGQLTILLTAADLALAGTYPVVVTNPTSGGGVSAAVYFYIINPQTANEWTWMSGANTTGNIGTYGTQGVAAAANVPGARTGAVSWIDGIGNLWLFGGNTATVQLNDLWRYSPVTTLWTWMGGSGPLSTGTTYVAGVYGQLGIPNSNNVPGSRSNAVSWTDSSGNFWLFGGNGADANGSLGALNDLWRYIPSSGTWTWMGGSSTLPASEGQAGIYGVQGTPSPNNVPGGRYGAVSWVDHNGDFWLFGGFGYDSIDNDGTLNDLWVYHPATGSWNWMSGSKIVGVGQPGVFGTKGVPSVANVPPGLSYASSWVDSNNNLWLFGGGTSINGSGYASNMLWKFSPSANTWEWVSGSGSGTIPGTYGTQGVPSSANVPGARSFANTWTDQQGNLWLFGGDGYDANVSPGTLTDLWEFNPTNATWTWIRGSNLSNAGGSYGILGVASASNNPPGRVGATVWEDSAGYVWLFGGNSNAPRFNDLWRYQP